MSDAPLPPLIRWDYGRQLRNQEGEVLCSVCYAAIPDESVPLMLWTESRHGMATFCGACESQVLKFVVKPANEGESDEKEKSS